MESEFDELDAGFDAQIANMLSPNLALLEGENVVAKPASSNNDPDIWEIDRQI